MTISELRAANELERDAILRPGDTLQVAQADAGSSSDNGRSVAYEIQPGDSLSSIARQFQVSVSDLRRWNSLNGDGIRAGETLTLYVAEGDDEALARARDT